MCPAVFCSGGRQALVTSQGKFVKLWDLETGKELRTFEHGGRVNGLAVTADGSRFLSVSDDMTLRLWDVESGRLLGKVEGLNSRLWRVAVSPDGRVALTGGEDQRGRLWGIEDAAAGVAPPAGPERRAAAWVLQIGGSVEVAVAGQMQHVRAAADLPEGPFQVIRVHLAGNQNVDDTSLKNLEGLTSLKNLDLNSCAKVTDQGLQHLQNLTALESLHLWGAPITDAGLVHLRNLTRMQWMNIGYNRTTGSALHHLEGMKELSFLSLNATQLTDAHLQSRCAD
jgi:hypothetical protein